jgi:hypothetical protein
MGALTVGVLVPTALLRMSPACAPTPATCSPWFTKKMISHRQQDTVEVVAGRFDVFQLEMDISLI